MLNTTNISNEYHKQQYLHIDKDHMDAKRVCFVNNDRQTDKQQVDTFTNHRWGSVMVEDSL